MIVKIVA